MRYVGEMADGRWSVGEAVYSDVRQAVAACRVANGGGLVEVWGLAWAWREVWADDVNPLPHEWSYDRAAMSWRRVG